jgi:hypothetical protein
VARTSALVDLGRREWLMIWPGWAEIHWQDLAAATQNRFERVVFGVGGLADADSQSGWTVRALFGAAQIAEQLRVLEAGLDDIAVERAKLILLQGRPAWAGARILLIGIAPNELIWQVQPGDSPVLRVHSDRSLLDADWPTGFLPGPLGSDPYVNHQRFFLAPVPADPLTFDMAGTRATPTSREHFRLQ